MPYCPHCGSPTSGGKFCSNCGVELSASVSPPESIGPLIRDKTLVGIYQELEPEEKLGYQSVTLTPVIFVKEAEIKKVIGRERKEIPISLSQSFFYLTSKRLLFLKLFEMLATELGEGRNQLANVAGTFYDIPLGAITGVEMRPIQLNKKDVERFVDFFGGDETMLRRPSLEIIFDEAQARGRAKDYVEALMRRGLLSRLWGKVEMVYDKVFILGEQSVAIMPRLKENIRTRSRWV